MDLKKDFAMKIVLAGLVISPFVLAGAAQAGHALSVPPPAGPSAIHLADAVNSADRKTYVQKKEAEMAQWRRKIGDFTARTETNATEADQAVKREIERAFTHVEEASSKLDATGEDGYEDAKAAYERASRDLEATWAKVDPAKN